jgi:hypothetical protein
MSEPFNASLTLKLSIQRALLGEVTLRLVSVTCGIKEQLVILRTYVTGPVQAEDLERLSAIAGEVIADFPKPYEIQEQCISLQDAKEEMLDFWAFRRST